MDEENRVSYYSIIPATIRYDDRLKPAEKLIYGEITSLANSMGYCYAKNRYFAKLYNVTNHTVSGWISNLEKCGYIYVQLIKDAKNVIKERRIFIVDTPYVQKNTYPYVLKNTYPMYKKVQENNIKYNIDDFILLLINKSEEIPKDFYSILERLELIYPKKIINRMEKANIEMLNDIIYTLYELYNNGFSNLLSIVQRETLINLYVLTKNYSPEDLLNYYKRAIINKYTNNST